MTYLKQSLSVALGCLAGWSIVAVLPLATMAASVTCAHGETPLPLVGLASVDLPPDLPAGSSVEVTRQTVSPGADVVSSHAPYTAYIVVSGAMEFQRPMRGGWHMEYPALCQPENGVFTGGGGVEEVDADGWMPVEAGSTLVAEDIVIQDMRNAGSKPLDLLLVTVSVPDIDPATGQTIGLQVSDAGNEHRKQERRDRKARATPTP